MTYCRRCGESLTNVERHIFSCRNNHTIYTTPSPTAGVFFIDENNNVLLSVRGIEPHKGMLDSIGGFVDPGESLEAAVVREIEEELGLVPTDYSELTFLSSAVGNYPYEDDVLPVLTSFFYGQLNPDALPIANDDVAAITWVPLHAIDPASLHDDDVRGGIAALKNKFLK